MTGEGKFTEDIIILCVFYTSLHYFCIACHDPWQALLCIIVSTAHEWPLQLPHSR